MSVNSCEEKLRHLLKNNNFLECWSKPSVYDRAKEAADFICSKTSYRPEIALICGSGFAGVAEILENQESVPFVSVPHFPTITVEGHEGCFKFGKVGEVPLACLQGRFHWYEGYSMQDVTLPVRVLKLMGVKLLILTNSAGGLNENFEMGDIMLIKNHIFLPGMAGQHPLVGPNDSRFGKRFPSVHDIYSDHLLSLAKQAAESSDLAVKEGVYVMVSGPSYETVAELHMLRIWGADAVGMSTAPEAIVACHCGMQVLALSVITNLCNMTYESSKVQTHEEVLQTGAKKKQDCEKLIKALVPALSRHLQPEA